MSLYVARSKQEVIAEYAASSGAGEDHAKAKWGSEASMLNRFRLGLTTIRWDGVRRWLDVGCSVGRFFALAEEEGGLRFEQLVGIDITATMIDEARRRSFASPTDFQVADLEEAPCGPRHFDLVTMLGVLQQCGSPPEKALAAAAAPLADGGQIFITTKNLGWRAFSEDGLVPEANHSWFYYSDIEKIIKDLGLTIVDSGGFLPAEGRRTELSDSHSFFLLARRGS